MWSGLGIVVDYNIDDSFGDGRLLSFGFKGPEIVCFGCFVINPITYRNEGGWIHATDQDSLFFFLFFFLFLFMFYVYVQLLLNEGLGLLEPWYG